LAAREKENQTLQKEVDKLKAQVEELKNRLAQAEPRWVTLRRLSES
jgi:cell division protein FtsB